MGRMKVMEQHWQEDIEMSSSLTIVKMTLSSINMILGKILESGVVVENKTRFELSESHLDAITSLLTDFEENGDIVEGVYLVLAKFLSLALGDAQPPSVRVMES